MKKSDFFALLAGTVGGLLFALGICMCLLPEWGLTGPGKPVAAVGLLILLALAAARFRSQGKKLALPSPKLLASVVLGVAGALILGVGMCCVMVWGMMIPGILIGIVGIVLLLCLIPLTVGLK